ncbi:MAG TPA: hypothetical protein VMT32_10295 [Bryobacteraceae bacterium]|nr:hypothetical protein [Bryobacteraceae bacterium]
MTCAYCGKKIPVLRKLKDAEFCSAAHRRAYLKKQEDLALDFLLQNKQRPKPAAPLAEPSPAESRESEPQPLLVAADFVAERVIAAAIEGAPEQNAQPVAFVPDRILPAGNRPSPPAPRLAGFAPLSVAADSCAAQACVANLSAAPFAGEHPRIPGSPIRPLWIEPVREAPKERPAAGFVPLGPRWVHGETREARPAAALRPTTETFLLEVTHSPCAPVLRLAPPARCTVEMSPSPQASSGRNQAIRTGVATQPVEPRTAIRLRARGLSCSEGMALPLPAAKPASRGASVPAECHSRTRGNPAWTPAAFTPGRPSLACAAQAAVQPPHAILPETSTADAKTPILWKCQVRIGPHTRVSAIPPLFEVPAREDLDLDIPVRGVAAVAALPLTTRLLGLIHAMPVRSRRLAVLAPLAAIVWAGIHRLDHSAAAGNAQNEMWSRIRQRAAVEIQDDFRSGLSQWTGGADWAKSWSYDGIGFARPGRLALLSRSLPLGDYRLEFAAQIERKAVGWVFRASDARNYYATKLIESKQGPAPAFFIVRYAMIDGRERFKVQLPLPVTPSIKTMLHVRQEIRGAQFTTYLDGHVMDTWSDATLARGGVGFFADAGESSYIRWIEVAQNDDALGRIYSYLASVHDQ